MSGARRNGYRWFDDRKSGWLPGGCARWLPANRTRRWAKRRDDLRTNDIALSSCPPFGESRAGMQGKSASSSHGMCHGMCHGILHKQFGIAHAHLLSFNLHQSSHRHAAGLCAHTGIGPRFCHHAVRHPGRYRLQRATPPDAHAFAGSFPTGTVAAYNKDVAGYSTSNTYLGYFDYLKCYDYDSTNGYFKPISVKLRAPASPTARVTGAATCSTGPP